MTDTEFNDSFVNDQEYSFDEQDLRILKNILTSPQLLYQFSCVNGGEFLRGDAKEVGQLILGYHDKFKSIPTQRVLFEKIEDNKKLKSKLNALFQELERTDSSPDEFRYDLNKIKNRYLLDKKDQMSMILKNSNDDVWYQSLKVEIEKVEHLRNGRKQLVVRKDLKTYIDVFKFDYAEKIKNPDYKRGVLTGYSCLDYITNGMFPAELLIIGGESSSGKSALLNNVAKQMWMQKNSIYSTNFTKGYNVQYFSLEMPFEACFRRTLACVAETPLYGLRDSTLSPQEFKKTQEALEFIANYQSVFEIVDIARGASVDHIEAKFLESCDEHPIDIVVVDYLGLLEEPHFNGDDWLKMAYIAGRLHEFARTYNIIVLTAVQLNRIDPSKLKNSVDAIGLHRIGRSSGIMHHANIGLQIETRQNEKTYPDLPYHIIKNRDGELASHQLMKNFRCSSLKDPEIPFQPENSLLFGTGETWDTDKEDISDMLQKYGWGA